MSANTRRDITAACCRHLLRARGLAEGASLCVQGQRELYAYCEQKGIPTDRCGKVIVAVADSELPRLDNLLQRGQANGVEGLEMIGPERLREIEPHCVGVKALYSPNTGIVDYSRVNRVYAEDVQAGGGEVLPGHGVAAMSGAARQRRRAANPGWSRGARRGVRGALL